MVRITDWLSPATTGERVQPTDRESEGVDSGVPGWDSYNYRRFRFLPSRDGVHDGVKAGEEAVDATVYTLDGDSVSLSSLWEDGPIVLEFGSITCPVFSKKIEAMNDLAAEYGDEVDFYVVYTREAHPGNRYHRHTSFEQKCQHARDAKRTESVNRGVLVDDLEGTMHRAYGSLPNSAYLVGGDGVVAHQADWLDPDVLEDKIVEVLEHDGRGAAVSPSTLTLQEHAVDPDPDLIRAGVRVHSRAGGGSFRDLLVSLPRMLAYRLKLRLPGRNSD